ncbi:MAG: DUF2071 domain-containing protein [Thermoanaerobaculia bacterium]|nr:DUF2071 domain-containing protein [Thermoanaerobaculia bacterium]
MSDAGDDRGRVFLTAEWRWLVMLNYPVEARVLAPRVPPGTELDLWEGRPLVSMVAFRFLRTRLLGVPIPFHRDFDEINLRFYVRRRTADGVRRGVVFVKEVVPRRAIAWVARLFYGENYVYAPTRHRLPGLGDGRLEFSWRLAGRWHRLAARVDQAAELPSEESEERFVTEHYWGYAARRGGGTTEYRVEHPPWPVYPALAPELECDVAALYGPELAPFLEGPPTSAFVAAGSPVTVHWGRRLPPAGG